jgi:hypothetical protein
MRITMLCRCVLRSALRYLPSTKLGSRVLVLLSKSDIEFPSER